MLDLEINMSKGYQNIKRKRIPKDIMDKIHDKNTESNLILIKKESYIFGLLFIGDGAIMSRTPMLNILVSGKKIPVDIL